MGDIIPFIARVRDGGDWTAAERARLDALVQQFSASGDHVEVVYGVTDEGDPWCVVKDENEDVLLHVARIDGKFVVHQAADDSLAEASDLPSALSQHLATMDAPSPGVVVPFAASARQMQTLIALLVATAFVYDHREAQGVEALDLHVDLPSLEGAALHAAAPVLDAAPRQERELAGQGSALTDAAPTHAASASAATVAQASPEPPRPSESLAPREIVVASLAPAASHGAAPVDVAAIPVPASGPHVIVGGDHGEVLAGGAQAELIRGGAGDDTLSGGGAGPGQYDTLMGGAGDDRIEVTAQVVAVGGAGADTFVIETPKGEVGPDAFLGFIADFHPEEGDRLVNHHGGPVTFVLAPEGFQARVHPPEPAPGVMPNSTSTVFVDLNGDGRPDGFLVMGHGPPVTPSHDPSHDPGQDTDPIAAMLSVGQAPPHPPLIG